MVHFGILSKPRESWHPRPWNLAHPNTTVYFPVSVAPLRRRAMVDRTVTAAGVLNVITRRRGERGGGRRGQTRRVGANKLLVSHKVGKTKRSAIEQK